MLYQGQKDPSQAPIETAGICTGVLPAILAASFSSYHSAQFQKAAVNGFRLAFWIGFRVSLFCRSAAGEMWQDHAWALSVFGISAEELEAKLTGCKSDPSKTPSPRLSAIFPDTLSLTGHGSELEQLKSVILSGARYIHCRTPHIHGYYHGGENMIDVVNQVRWDAERRNVRFPTWESLQISVRSADDGVLMSAKDDGVSLLETALGCIFVETVNWKKTWSSLTQSLISSPDQDPKTKFRIIGMGPKSGSLVRDTTSVPLPASVTVIEELSEYFRETPPDAIAIVGLSANYPSGKGQEEFWSTLANGVCSLSKIPESRFDTTQYQQNSKRKLGNEQGNFLQDPFKFDAAYFNISPREAKSMDPQQRLLLHAAIEALEDAGYAPNSTPTFQKETFGVYVGVATEDYVDNLREEIDMYYSPGTLRAFLSGRISYVLGLSGPSIVIDTACSSSMVALYHACRALQNGDCTAALAGGVNVISSPDGCGLVVVKKLSDAIQEGDYVYGVIRGIGVNQCGTSKSITHPDSDTQAELFKQVLGRSRISPETISAVEAHGTGTQAGDYAEICSLQSVLGSRSSNNPLHLMSLKGNIGHAEAASGVANLAKLLLMMEKKKIPPQASFKTLSPRLNSINDHNIVVPTQLIDWNSASPKKSPRRALLNNFGAAGSNAALILEEYVGDQRSTRRSKLPRQRSAYVLNVSAKTPSALEQLRQDYISYIERGSNIRMEDLCYTANARRREEDYTHRLSVVGCNVGEMITQLRQPRFLPVQIPREGQRRTIFVFSGQGGIYPGMGAELLTTAPHFRAAVDRCDDILVSHGYLPTSPFLGDSGSWSDHRDRIVVEQSACFVVEYSLAQLLLHWGIKPDAVAGHSIGEYAALVTVGALDLKEALLFVAKRAKLMTLKCPASSSGMLACRLSASVIDERLSRDTSTLFSLSVACENSAEDSVVAGPLHQLARFAEICKVEGVKHKLLGVSYGFHSSAMDPILEDLKQHFCSSTLTKSCTTPAIKVGLSSYGRVLRPDEELEPDYFAKQTRNPVQFSKVSESLAVIFASSNATILEIGPSPITLPMLKTAFNSKTTAFIPTLKPADKPWVALSTMLQSLYLQGFQVLWREVYHDPSVKLLRPFPHYPLAGSEFLVPFQERKVQFEGNQELENASTKSLISPFEFLVSNGTPMNNKTGGLVFETPTKQFATYIKAHAVGGVPLCPASVYMEFALEALAVKNCMETSVVTMKDVAFDKPLVYSDDGTKATVQLELEQGQDFDSQQWSKFSFRSGDRQLHCTGSLGVGTPKSTTEYLARKAAYVKRQRLASFSTPSDFKSSQNNTFSSRTIYDLIFPRVVAYSDPFLTLNRLTVSSTGLEGYGLFKLSSSAVKGRFVCPPPFIDTMLHAAGFIANMQIDPDTACICVKIESAILPGNHDDLYSQELDIYCSLVDIGDSIVADAYVVTPDQKVVSCVEGMFFKKVPLRSFKAHLARSLKPPAQNKRPSAPKLMSQARERQQIRIETDARAIVETPGRPQQTSNVEATVYSILQDVCGVGSDVSASSSLAEIGVDSLLFIELTDSMHEKLPQIDISRRELEGCGTVGDLLGVITNATKRVSNASTPSTLYSQATTTRGPSTMPSTPPTPVSDSQIEHLFLDVCGLSLSEADKNVPLVSLGVDSLLSIELAEELQNRFGLTIGDGHDGISDLTVHQLENLCSERLGASRSTAVMDASPQQGVPKPAKQTGPVFDALGEEPFPVKIRQKTKGGSKASLYLFHDGSGLCSMYRHLSDINRDVHGIFSLDLSSVDPNIQSMEQLAQMYIERAGLLNESDVLLGGE
ncbi:hypothetical protein B0T17DRAFT_647009 [Bombardia bombarda]|uniref:Polyketide synthase n=1 Tax=Bombardia bombarda TaxID=252184 RepID=A0AA39WH29_9PEZI|nr:hypothetical protein B0T17DRAFT_647009 [Bombardia bombarda]